MEPKQIRDGVFEVLGFAGEWSPDPDAGIPDDIYEQGRDLGHGESAIIKGATHVAWYRPSPGAEQGKIPSHSVTVYKRVD